MATGQTPGPRICKHCGTEIRGNAFVENETGVYVGEECLFRETYLDGIVARIEATCLVTIEALVNAADAREHEAGNHSLRVSRLAVILGYRSGLRDRELVDLYCGRSFTTSARGRPRLRPRERPKSFARTMNTSMGAGTHGD